ncbi:DUF6880 family protein [Rhodovulum steppense]|uniref:Uncharacterized protein n=1 Tax=Rhodovulum steppense TaxID=540251 RepID=A0A4R1YIZ1_9RHOB|nr:DUF6880 family protein [Rhodovulum steppense]TCM76401.1 hypothetical protein EV216_13429 [Rhodovulum steppense]
MTTFACGITIHGYEVETVARKTINKENLAAIGAEALADLLLDVTRGNSALRPDQRRAWISITFAQVSTDRLC